MKEIRNTTHEPLRVPLPQGKVLHLGPLQTGRVPATALDHPPFEEMKAAGRIEIVGDGTPESQHPFKKEKEPGD